MTFSAYLKKLREERNLTKTGLARAIGITTQYLVDVEAGRGKPPTPERCEQISNTLGLAEEERNKLFKLAAVERLSGHSVSYLGKIFETSSGPGFKVKEPGPEAFVRYLRKAIVKGVLKEKESAKKSEKDLVRIPLLKSANGGEKKFSYALAERWFSIPQELTRGREFYLFAAPDDSMAGDGIHAGDIVIVEAHAAPKKGEIVVALVKGKPLILLYARSKKNLKLRGVLRGVLWDRHLS